LANSFEALLLVCVQHGHWVHLGALGRLRSVVRFKRACLVRLDLVLDLFTAAFGSHLLRLVPTALRVAVAASLLAAVITPSTPTAHRVAVAASLLAAVITPSSPSPSPCPLEEVARHWLVLRQSEVMNPAEGVHSRPIAKSIFLS
jgi:hypothetical protein